MLRRPREVHDTDLPIPRRPLATDFGEIADLVSLCNAGRLYEVEDWINARKPLEADLSTGRAKQRRRLRSALCVAVEHDFFSLIELLLANGHDPNADDGAALVRAVRGRDHELIELLFRFGADAGAVDFCSVLETCDRGIIDRFVSTGVDPCADNALARALHLKARPILGFVKSSRDRFPGIQRQVDIALHRFVVESDEKGVALMVWLGGDPAAEVPSDPSVDDDSSGGCHENALVSAVWRGRYEIFRYLPIDPARVSLNYLLRQAINGGSIKIIQKVIKAGADPTCVDGDEGALEAAVHSVLLSGNPRYSFSVESRKDASAVLSLILARGGKYPEGPRSISVLRRRLLKCSPAVASNVMQLLQTHSALSVEALKAVTKGSSMRRHLTVVEDAPTKHPPPQVAQPPSPIEESGRQRYFRLRSRSDWGK